MGWVRLDCDLGNVCACANVVMTRWRAFRLSTSSCLTSVTSNHTMRSNVQLFRYSSKQISKSTRNSCLCAKSLEVSFPPLLFPFTDVYWWFDFLPLFFCETAFVSYIFFEILSEKLARARAKISFLVHTPRLTAVLILNEVERLRGGWVFAHKEDIVTLVTSQRWFFQTGR